MPIDILAGSSSRCGATIDDGRTAADVAAGWERDLAVFDAIRRDSLLY